MFIKSKKWSVNIQFQHEKRIKQCENNSEDLMEATGASVEEEDNAESLKKL